MCSCPVCQCSDFTYHARYKKYHYQKQIDIIRVYCLNCKSTHALIPEFSVPGTSIGAAEAENYMIDRSNGKSQKETSEIFISKGMNDKYGISLEKRFHLANMRAQVLFPLEEDILHDPLKMFTSEFRPVTSVISLVNRLFLTRGYNPLYFSRINILRIREQKMGMDFPQNPWASVSGPEILDSG